MTFLIAFLGIGACSYALSARMGSLLLSKFMFFFRHIRRFDLAYYELEGRQSYACANALCCDTVFPESIAFSHHCV